MNDLKERLHEGATSFAVVGATDSAGKYGGIIYRDLRRKGYSVYAVNPNRDEVAGDEVWTKVTDLPEKPTMVVLVVPAQVGRTVLADAAEAGIDNIWVQPGAFSEELKGDLEAGGFNWTAGSCVMVETRAAAS